MIHNFKLGELFEIQIGKTPARGDKKMWDLNKKSNNIWLSIRDLNQTDANGYISDSAEYITDDGAKLVKIIPKNTLLLSFKLTLGRTAITKIPLRTNEAIAALLPKTDQCDIRYLKYYFEYFNFVKFAGNDFKVKGLTLNKKKLADIPIPVPSLQDQEKIVERLDKVFANIDTILSNNALKKNLYSDYFESITWDELIENDKFSKNPISNFFELDPSKSEIINENLDEVSFIPMADVDELTFEVNSKQIKDFKEVKKGYKYFADGDFLLAKITPCLKMEKWAKSII
jgi:restriction endonuclease S subunit